jgi:hypothetical protein
MLQGESRQIPMIRAWPKKNKPEVVVGAKMGYLLFKRKEVL